MTHGISVPTVRNKLSTSIAAATVLLSVIGSKQVLAQGAASEQEAFEEIIVTGSFIAGTSTEDALPVDVMRRSDLESLGAPTTTDIINNLSINSGSENRSNPLGGQNRNVGTGNVNLRGLGLDKTLVLFNGKRQTIHSTSANDGASFVDINTIPGIAIERIEILKDGAAAIYGSDAVAGVVNFITRTDFEGLELSGSYRDRWEDQNQGNYDVSGIWGWADDSSNLVVSAVYSQVEALTADELDFAHAIPENIRGTSSVAGPGAIVPVTPAAGTLQGVPLRELGCEANGGIGYDATGAVLQPDGVSTAPLPPGSPFEIGRCGYDFVKHFHVAHEQEKFNLWSTYNIQVSDRVKLYAEAAYYKVDIEDSESSPSFPVLNFAVIPANHPGNFLAPALGAGATGIYLGRPFGQNFQSALTQWEYETYRALGGVKVDLAAGWSMDFSVNYSENNMDEKAPVIVQERFENALLGLGGPNCDTSNPANAGNAAVNCYYFNPFNTRYTTVPNRADVENYLRSTSELDQTSSLFVTDLIFAGDLFQLSSGYVQAAFGLQYRDSGLEVKRDRLSTIPGSFTFVGGGAELDEDQDVLALFAELAIPLANNIEAQVAVRYEDYGGKTGDTVDPKLALKWTVNDYLGLRASASTTFRAPTLHQQANRRTSLEPISDNGVVGFNGVETTGNPNLKPESADAFNFGALLSPTENFDISLDYWNIDFEDVIGIEDAQTKVSIENLLCPDPIAVPSCADPDILRSGAGTIFRVIARFENAPAIEADGLDVNASYLIDTANLGQFTLGFDAGFIFSYDISGLKAVVGGGVGTVEVDAKGKRNEFNLAPPLPEWRGNLALDWNYGQHSSKAVVRYIDDYEDDKTADRRFNKTVDSLTTLDLHYTYRFTNERTTFGFNLTNATDEEPPFADQDLNFDARTHSPFGRQFQLVFRHQIDF